MSPRFWCRRYGGWTAGGVWTRESSVVAAPSPEGGDLSPVPVGGEQGVDEAPDGPGPMLEFGRVGNHQVPRPTASACGVEGLTRVGWHVVASDIVGHRGT